MSDDQRKEISWLDGLPKTELHVHLEGSIPLDSLWELVQKHGGDPDVPHISSLRERFRFRDFPHFIETWIWKNRFLRSYEDFTFISEAVARNFARQNIRYAEVFFSPADFTRQGLKPQELTHAIREGLSRVPGIEVRLIADFVRDFGPERAAQTLREVHEVMDQGVIGIGIGGSEQRFPPEPFADVFEDARRLGFHTTAHAGEAAGAPSVRAAVEVLHAERIGHGTRAHEDPTLVDLLARRRIPIEACPISNVRTGVVPRLDDHPIRLYMERGIPVTINSDDPTMFGTSLVNEFLGLRTDLGFSREDVLVLLRQSIECSWAPQERKKELLAELAAAR
jgi:adenosine deaminase